LEKRLNLSVSRHLAHKRQSMERVVASLGALNPLSVLGRGYSLVQSEEGHVIPAASGMVVGEQVTLRFSDGTACVTVNEIHIQENKEVTAHHE
jgi:exodeoxyribonuclease VII large subunit